MEAHGRLGLGCGDTRAGKEIGGRLLSKKFPLYRYGSALWVERTNERTVTVWNAVTGTHGMEWSRVFTSGQEGGRECSQVDSAVGDCDDFFFFGLWRFICVRFYLSFQTLHPQEITLCWRLSSACWGLYLTRPLAASLEVSSQTSPNVTLSGGFKTQWFLQTEDRWTLLILLTLLVKDDWSETHNGSIYLALRSPIYHDMFIFKLEDYSHV